MFCEVTIISTSAKPGASDYSTFDARTERYGSEQEVAAWLRETYGDCKRDKMYVDKTDGSIEHVGYIYCFRNADWSHAPVERWNQRDWVCIYAVSAERVIIRPARKNTE